MMQNSPVIEHASKNTDQEYFIQSLNESLIRPLQLAEIFPGIEKQSVEIGAIDPDTSHLNHVDMLYVCAIARHIKAKWLFEFGTYLGRTTYHLALGENVEKVFTLDLDAALIYPKEMKLGRAVQAVHQRGLQGYFFQGQECASHITQLLGDCRTFNYEPYSKKMDFIFIDGGHTYDLVANDSERAFDMLKVGGVIVWHDFALKSPGVVSYAKELSSSRSLFWVRNTSLLIYIDGINSMRHKVPEMPYARSVLKPNV